ncbi:hypothetical protein [Chryseobacterium koreense]|nr:hypothetical protein [Chryseobacterium koreense]MBB5334542.1 hypothetical protein [Chryseobacterium koreense]
MITKFTAKAFALAVLLSNLAIPPLHILFLNIHKTPPVFLFPKNP